MLKPLIMVLTGVIVLVGSNGASAFDMNPIDVDCWGKDYLCKLTKSSEKVKFPVHETITLLAYDCRQKPDACRGGTANTSAEVLKKSGRLRDLELGSEWNDDPDSLLRQGVTKSLQWYALFKDAKMQAECKNQQSPKCKEVQITQNPMMLYRSHFGDLQFIHSMASTDEETAETTKKKIMAWAKFTYNIFIAEKSFDNEDLSFFPEISEIINKPGWTVGALFDPVPSGEWKRSSNPLKFGRYVSNGKPREQNHSDEISVKHIAFGSLLHLVQDSFSDSHVAREFGCNPLECSNGKIIAFRNYAGQIGDDHSIADVYPEWLKHGELPRNNAVWASAQLINFAFSKTPWDTVEEFLDREVFPLNNPLEKPQPGDKGCFEGRSGSNMASVPHVD